jgi:hypothetical protein
MKAISIAAVSFIALSAGSAFASPSTVNAVFEAPRIFNDFTTSSLTITNNFAASVRIQESGYADDSVGGNFANKHAFWYSDNGGVSPLDYNYGDGFYFSVTVTDSSTGIGGSEVGMNSDLFGFGFFGSGIGPGGSEIAAFGGTLPFHSFGSGLYTQGDALGLAMIYRPGPAEFGLPAGTIEYRYQINGGGWVSSGQIVFTNTEGGFPSGGFNQFFGFGAQFNNPIGGSADVLFENIVAVPAPGAAALLGLGGLVVARRRR